MTAKDETATGEAANTDHAPSFRNTALWMIASLGLRVTGEQDQTFVAEVPEPRRRDFGGSQWRFCFDGPQDVRLHPQSEPWRLLFQQWTEHASVLHAAPSRQAVQVHEISSILLNAYEAPEGQLHLGGCTLEDRPLLMLLAISGDDSNGPHITEFFFDRDATAPDAQRVETLGMREVTPLPQFPAAESREATKRWIEQSKAAVEAAVPGACWTPIIVWCKFAEGKVVATIGDKSVQIAFADWASRFAQGQVQPPPYTCPMTGVTSYRLAATDEGVITAAEAIGVCAESGRKVLTSELARCEATDRLLLKEKLTVCPTSGRSVAINSLVECEMCRQRVDPGCLTSGRCQACRSLRSVRKVDPRMAQVLGEFPKLDQWGSWRIAETRQVFILTASSFVRRLLVVMNKEPLEIVHLAVGSRLSPRWSPAPDSLRDELSRPAG